MSGGASRETWSFTADGERRILRRDPPGASKGGMQMEAALLRAAAAEGVPVPDVIAAGDDWIVMSHVDGETIARKILRDEEFAGARPKMAHQCGTILAALHRIPVETTPLDEPEPLQSWRDTLDSLGPAHPAFELAFKWLEANRPSSSPKRTVVHGDFRHGNFIVGPDGIRAILDWELAHIGDPMEDLGWLCVNAWRFGVRDKPVGGFGDYDDLIAAYEAAGGGDVDREALLWWETLGTLKWGVMCILQASVHTSGAIRSVELAAIGRRVCENEWDLMQMLPPLR